jgi:hypothetical protein
MIIDGKICITGKPAGSGQLLLLLSCWAQLHPTRMLP